MQHLVPHHECSAIITTLMDSPRRTTFRAFQSIREYSNASLRAARQQNMLSSAYVVVLVALTSVHVACSCLGDQVLPPQKNHGQCLYGLHPLTQHVQESTAAGCRTPDCPYLYRGAKNYYNAATGDRVVASCFTGCVAEPPFTFRILRSCRHVWRRTNI